MRSSSSRALHEKIIPTAVIISRKKKKKERKTREYNTQEVEGLKWNDDIPRLPPGD